VVDARTFWTAVQSQKEECQMEIECGGCQASGTVNCTHGGNKGECNERRTDGTFCPGERTCPACNGRKKIKIRDRGSN
jgi:hypothetical protein